MKNQNVKPEPDAPESEGADSRSHLSPGSEFLEGIKEVVNRIESGESALENAEFRISQLEMALKIWIAREGGCVKWSREELEAAKNEDSSIILGALDLNLFQNDKSMCGGTKNHEE